MHSCESLNSVVGKLPGGAAYMSTLGSAVLGALSGSNSANTVSHWLYYGFLDD
ncbi:TRAP transporter large permease subunit [Bacillus sp. SL00103]